MVSLIDTVYFFITSDYLELHFMKSKRKDPGHYHHSLAWLTVYLQVTDSI